MAGNAKAEAGPGSAQRRNGPTLRPAAPAKPPRARRRRRRGARRFDRSNSWQWLSALAPALHRGVDRIWRRLRRCAPVLRRGRAVRLVLPAIETAADIAAMLDAITAAVRRGNITPAEAASLAEVADAYVRAIETREFDRRLRALETAHAATP
jgi:hypothetical protein